MPERSSCPLPKDAEGCVTLAHGEGGRLMRRWIHDRLLEILGNEWLRELPDAAHVPCSSEKIAFTTDSFVVSPLFFPGGDIGTLAVYGTINDLAVSGARPQWLSLALIIEEGLPLATLIDGITASQCLGQRSRQITAPGWRAPGGMDRSRS